MPAFYKIDKETQAGYEARDLVAYQRGLLGHQERLLKDPEFDPTFSSVVRFHPHYQSRYHAEDVRLAARKTIFSPQSHRAMLVKDDLNLASPECLNPS